MKLESLQAALGSAMLLLNARRCSAEVHRHHHSHPRHSHGHLHSLRERDVEASSSPLERRGAGCTPPTDGDIVLITPGAANKGWAMSPDQVCNSGMYCPFACPPGKVMAQWEPGSTYTYPASMNGGLFCEDGVAKKPFADKPYCVDGTGTVTAVNKCGPIVSFCQTVLPGNEAMLIPTDVVTSAVLAVPDITYWQSTAAHYYINPPGVPASEGCIWGSADRPIGNWSPYVAGANTDANGQTFLKIGWNPVYFEPPDMRTQVPKFGVKIECADGAGCNGLPCEIDPSKVGVGGVTSPVSATGAGGADFCVVTVPSGAAANIVVFNAGDSGASGGTPAVSKPPAAGPSASSSAPANSGAGGSATSVPLGPPSVLPGIFHENGTSPALNSAATTGAPGAASTNGPNAQASSNGTGAATTSASSSEGVSQGGGAAVAGLLVAFVAAAWMY